MKINNLPLQIVNEYIVDSPAPSNLNYMWNFGSLLGLNLVILIISGISLAMHYTPSMDLAFLSVEHIMRDVNNGWIIRYIHQNGAAFFFILVYIHIARGLYYGSYKAPRGGLWVIGIIIYFIMMATAFLGYVLPMGQMSIWGAAVITNLISIISMDLVYFIWGNFSVSNPTLNRFYSIHFLLPFILTALVILHLMTLHQNASNNPIGIESLGNETIRFHPYYTSKDLVGFAVYFLILCIVVFFFPSILAHPDNNIPANQLVTPLSIVPEFYFLPFYAILRAIPNKTLGVLALLASILLFLFIPLSPVNTVRSNRFKPIMKFIFWIFVANFLFLMWIGAQPISQPYVFISQISSVIHFLYIFLLLLF